MYCLFTICFVLSVSNIKRLPTNILFGKCVIMNTIFYELLDLYFMIIYETKLHLLFMPHHFVAGNRMLTLSMYAIKSWLTLLCGQFLIYVTFCKLAKSKLFNFSCICNVFYDPRTDCVLTCFGRNWSPWYTWKLQ